MTTVVKSKEVRKAVMIRRCLMDVAGLIQQQSLRAIHRIRIFLVVVYSLALVVGFVLALANHEFEAWLQRVGLAGPYITITGLWCTPLITPSGLITELLDLTNDQSLISIRINCSIAVAVLVIAQIIFVFSFHKSSRVMVFFGQSPKRLFASEAFVTSLVSLGAIAILAELIGIWQWLSDWKIESVRRMLLLWVLIMIGWMMVFYRHPPHGNRYEQSVAVIKYLLIGSVVVLAISIGVHVLWDSDRAYWVRGSYSGMVLAIVTLLWAGGPGLYLLFNHESYLAAKQGLICSQCGYDLRGAIDSLHIECPECGLVAATENEI